MVDTVEIVVSGGDGGDGAVSLHREKFAPRGGPDGGDGGDGGDIIIEADRNLDDLAWFKSRRAFHAGDGANGGRNKRAGKAGADMAVRVPPGTVLWETSAEGRVQVAELLAHRDRYTAARGGRGGWGNVHFATPSRQVPTQANAGMKGEEKRLELELRLSGDVALVGPPNSGKSALLAAATRARVAVGDFPFTTREPVMGVAHTGAGDMLLVELPGLVPGSHQGKGLGNGFLRHALRARLLVFVVAGDAADPVGEYLAVQEELSQYSAALAQKPRLVCLTRADLEVVEGRGPALRGEFRKLGVPAYLVSPVAGRGVEGLLEAAWAEVARDRAEVARPEQCAPVVLRPKPKRGK